MAVSEYRGLAFPLRRRPGGALQPIEGRELLKANLRMLLLTPIGSRPMVLEYGSRLSELIFQVNDDVLAGLAQTFIVDAVKRWEPRVQIREVRTRASAHTFSLEISYVEVLSGEEDFLPLEFERRV